MFKSTLRLTKGIGVLVLILLISASVGVAHYTMRGGNLTALENQAAKALHKDKASVQGRGVFEKGKAFTQDLASRVLGSEKQPAERKSASRDTARSPTGDIRVYFAPCQPLNPFGIDDAFLEVLNSARKSIYGAFYEFQFMPAAEVLIAKHKAGVVVRMVSDSDYKRREAIQSCIQAGIPVVFDEREAFMHDKFCVVDDTFVWTGSTNATENCMYRNNNNSLLITSPTLAADYAAEFGEMFTSRRFGKGSPSNTPYPEVTVGDVRIECYFAPEDHVRRAIVRTIKTAQTEIDFMAFSFTSDEIGKAMAERMDGGVRVRGIFDARLAKTAHSEHDFLAKHGADVHLDRNQYAMHHKAIVIDSQTVITGSYNFTEAAETKNDENVLIIHSPAVADLYHREFESLLPR